MTDDERIELLAQALWTRVYGLRRLTPKWQAFVATDTAQVQALRTKAREMLGIAQSATGGAATRRPHSSLGWLM